MRIIALVTDGFGGFGGIAAYNHRFLTALATAGHDVTILPMDGDGKPPRGIRQFAPNHSKLFYTLTLLRILITEGPFDLVWCGHVGLAPLARLSAIRYSCPFWLQIHGIDAWDPPGFLKRWGLATASRVTAVSRYTRRRFLAWAPQAPEQVRVLPNTVEERFTPGPKPNHLLERYDLINKRVLLTVGRISATESYKGHDRVIKLLPNLLKTHPDVVYVIAGDGSGRLALQRLASHLGVSQSCRFLGKVQEAELVDHYRMAEAFVMPSTGEGFGIVYLESMASGIPAIGLDAGGSPDPLSMSELGYCVHESSLATAMRQALEEKRPNSQKAIGEILINLNRIFDESVNANAESLRAPNNTCSFN